LTGGEIEEYKYVSQNQQRSQREEIWHEENLNEDLIYDREGSSSSEEDDADNPNNIQNRSQINKSNMSVKLNSHHRN
jgi:hypothetical protein